MPWELGTIIFIAYEKNVLQRLYNTTSKGGTIIFILHMKKKYYKGYVIQPVRDRCLLDFDKPFPMK